MVWRIIMGAKIQLTGQRFGRLIVLKCKHVNTYGNYVWLCKCDCGKVLSVTSGSLTNGHTQSCGCLHIKHGLTGSTIYSVWSAMKQRCHNKNNKYYENYGGRGIVVCDRWRNSFENFFHDMGFPPDGTTLERLNNDKNYEPSNCKWASQLEQRHNNRKNTVLSYAETKLLYQNFGISGY